jgi:hypothetical protein
LRLPFPERVPLVPVLYFAGVLCTIQQLQRTNLTFSLLCFFYIIVAAIAFNLAGGFTQTSGAFVFFNATLGVIIGLCVKAYVGEAAETNLLAPLLTMELYLSGMCMMLLAVYLSKKLSMKRPLLGKMVTDSNLQTATVGCLVAGLLILVGQNVLPSGNGTVISALNQLNRFFPLAIILGVINTIRRSGGTRSVNVPVLIAATISFALGVLSYSKEGMFGPIAAFLLAAASQRYKISRLQIIGALLATFFMFQYMVPYSQYGRTYRGESGFDIETSLSLLSNLGYVREQYKETSLGAYEERVLGYYNQPQGFFDRLEMISIDDALNNVTQQSGTYGLYPIVVALENIVPHFIWKNKPAILPGNLFAHEIGILSEEDFTTGVSFSSTASAFHLIGWNGIFFLAPVVWFCLFTIFDSLCGDTRKSPWGLLVLAIYAHAAPEADVGGIIYMCMYTVIAIVLAAVLGTYIMPLIGTLFIGPEGIMIRRGRPVQSIPPRRLPVAPMKADL